jgi:hypothetical protein
MIRNLAEIDETTSRPYPNRPEDKYRLRYSRNKFLNKLFFSYHQCGFDFHHAEPGHVQLTMWLPKASLLQICLPLISAYLM